MIDTFALLVSHGLLLLTVWKLVRRPDLDSDEALADEQPRGFLAGREAPPRA